MLRVQRTGICWVTVLLSVLMSVPSAASGPRPGAGSKQEGAATVNGADNVGLAQLIGRLEVGMQADLIAVAGDPLSDINALRNVAFVMRAGHVLVSRLDGVSTDTGR